MRGHNSSLPKVTARSRKGTVAGGAVPSPVVPAVLSQRNKKKVRDTSGDTPGPGCVQCGQAITENVCALQCDSCKAPDVWKCIECLGIPKESYDSLIDCKELYWFCSKCDSVISGSEQERVKNDDRIVGLLEKLLDKFTSLETRLNTKADESELCSLEQRITGLEMRMADDDVNDRMVAESKYNKVKEIDRKLSELEDRLNKEMNRNAGASQVVFASDKKEELSDRKEELDREQRKKNIIIYKLNEIDSEEAEDRRCGDSLQVHELCHNTLKVPITDGDITKIYRLGARESGKIRPLLVSFADIDKKFEVFRKLNELKSANDKFNSISIAHDLTPRQREEVKKVYAEAKAKLEKEESEAKASGSSNGLGNRKIVVVGQMSGKLRAILRDRK